MARRARRPGSGVWGAECDVQTGVVQGIQAKNRLFSGFCSVKSLVGSVKPINFIVLGRCWKSRGAYSWEWVCSAPVRIGSPVPVLGDGDPPGHEQAKSWDIPNLDQHPSETPGRPAR